MPELYWSMRWADTVGADGHLITRLVGTTAPLLTDGQVDAIRRAEAAVDSSRTAVDRAENATFAAAEANGLRAAWSCAAQSAKRAVRASIANEAISSDRWSIWQPAIRSAVSTAKALVARPYLTDEQFETLTCLWEDAVEPIPCRIELDPDAQPPVQCRECGGTAGARGVSEAEAARYARHLCAGDEHVLRDANQRLDAMRVQLGEYKRTHWDPETVRNELGRSFDQTPGISAKARAELERRFGVKPHHGKPWAGDEVVEPADSPQPRGVITEPVQGALL